MDRDKIMLDKLLLLSEKTQIKDPYKVDYPISKKTDMWFIMLPQWSHFLPPFSLARLSSVLLKEGYYTRCLDLNIKAWNLIRPYIDELGYDPWDSPKTFKWEGELYFKELHSYFEEFLHTAIDTIVKAKPKVIGFTVYYTNYTLVTWMKTLLKDRLPDTVFIAGGPSTLSALEDLKKQFDIVVVGEAEEIITEVLDSIENNTIQKSKFPIVLTQPFKQRLDLNNFPIPNYSEFDTNEYKIPNAIVSEFSRGCVAKCTFCMETHFWNYRQKSYLKVVDEIEHLNKHNGINAVWFVDSLLNGNLKELRLFAEELIKRDLNISWFGYGRHDGRMDLEYLKLLKQSGLVAFQFGSESGSNKVLEDMKKRVTREEMEKNFKDGAKVGLQAVTGWVIGFPTETISDFIDTLTILWRNRNTCITNITAAQRFFMNTLTIVGQNPDRFGIFPFYHEDCYIRKDFSLGKVQLLIRSKCMTVFLHELKSNKNLTYLPRPGFKHNHYEVSYDNDREVKEVEFENYNYSEIHKSTASPYKDNAILEPFGLFRLLWRIRGGYSLKLKFSPEMDLKEFGPSLSCNFTGEYRFSVDSIGNWKCIINIHYKQSENAFKTFPDEYYEKPNAGVLRARKLANPSWGMEGITDSLQEEFRKQVEINNSNTDLSFEFNDELNGSWGVKNKVAI